MKPTVQQGLTARAVEQGQELEVFNKEIIPVLGAVRDAANFEPTAKASLDTSITIGDYERLWESEAVPPGSATWLVEARIAAISQGAAAAYILRAAFYNSAGVPTQIGATTTVAYESNFLFDARFGVTSSTVFVEVRNYDFTLLGRFTAVVKVLEVIL